MTEPSPPRALAPRHVVAVTLGNALEFYDFLTYAFFAIQIGHAFFPVGSSYGSLMLSLATFGAGFATRPLGAIVIGAYADRVGRKPAMQLCFVLIGTSIVLLALTPSYETIGLAAPILVVVARLAQGFSLGGEIGSSTAYLAEASLPERRGFTVSLQGSSQQAAVLVASTIGAVLTAVLPGDVGDDYAWRIAFLLGGAAVPFGLWLRASLPETLHAARADADPTPAAGSRLAVARRSWRIAALAIFIIAGGTIATYIQIYFVTYAQKTLGMSQRDGFIGEAVNNVVAIPAVMLGGWLSDRHGRRPILLAGNISVLLLSYPVFAWIVAAHTTIALVTGLAVLGGISNFWIGAFYAALSEALPREVRSSVFGVVYSVAVAVFGGTTQLVVTWLIDVTGEPIAPVWYLLAAAALALVAIWAFPETAPVRRRQA